MRNDAVILACLAGLNLVAVTVTSIVNNDIPSALASSLATLVGAAAGVAIGSRSTVGGPTNGPEPA